MAKKRAVQKTIQIGKKNIKIKKKLIMSSIIIAALIAFISCFAFFGVFERIIVAAVVCGEKIMVADYNFYYSRYIMDFAKRILIYDTDYGLNFSKPLNEQQSYMTSDKTWAEHFRDQTLKQISKYIVASQKARQDNVQLSKNDYKKIDREIEKIRSNALNNGQSVNKYLKSQYGHGVTLKVVQEALEKICLAQRYMQICLDDRTITEDEIFKCYSQSKKWCDVVDYRIIYDSENNIETHADKKSTLLQGVRYTDINDYDIAEWLFDDKRNHGDEAVFKDSEELLNTVQFIARHKNETFTLNGRSILVLPEITMRELKPTEKQLKDAEEEAKKIFSKYIANPFEENFINLAQIYSYDNETYANGGAICGFIENPTDENIEKWFFDPMRKMGDIELFKTNGVWQIVYYCEPGDPYWKAKTIREIKNNEKRDIENKFTKTAVIEENAFGFLLVKTY